LNREEKKNKLGVPAFWPTQSVLAFLGFRVDVTAALAGWGLQKERTLICGVRHLQPPLTDSPRTISGAQEKVLPTTTNFSQTRHGAPAIDLRSPRLFCVAHESTANKH